jgi:hypothetical protein
MKKTKLTIPRVKKRDPIARDLLTPKYRQRVVPNKKRAQKTGDAKSLISKYFFSE